MRIAMFYHSLVSDWNHGNAHFLRGVATELQARGHEVRIYEPENAWSRQNLIRDHGEAPIRAFHRVYPGLRSSTYRLDRLDLDRMLDGADLVLVHEWNDPDLVARIGEHRRARPGYRLLFHDTHHRALTEQAVMALYQLRHYDGVLAFGDVIRDHYLRQDWANRAWTWHEAADPRIFKPFPKAKRKGDLVWVGNWGDEERTAELYDFVFGPARELGLQTRVHGVRYPEYAKRQLRDWGIDFRGWLANFEVPALFSRFRLTVHVPRRPYTRLLPGIPTIRPFEALACGIPLISAPWEDSEGLFRAGTDYLVARNGAEMQRLMKHVINDDDLASGLAKNGHETILARHTCAHRVDELMAVCRELGIAAAA